VAFGHGEKADPDLYLKRGSSGTIIVKKSLPPFYRKVIVYPYMARKELFFGIYQFSKTDAGSPLHPANYMPDLENSQRQR
jgi:hypothetical protein